MISHVVRTLGSNLITSQCTCNQVTKIDLVFSISFKNINELNLWEKSVIFFSIYDEEYAMPLIKTFC